MGMNNVEWWSRFAPSIIIHLDGLDRSERQKGWSALWLQTFS